MSVEQEVTKLAKQLDKIVSEEHSVSIFPKTIKHFINCIQLIAAMFVDINTYIFVNDFEQSMNVCYAIVKIY